MFGDGGRNPYLDNVKFVVIVSVVVGHVCEVFYPSGGWSRAIVILFLGYIIPIFSIISGYLSSAEASADRYWRLLAYVALPLLLFQILYQAWDAWLFEHPFRLQLDRPYWLLWYFFCLLMWRAALPIIAHLRYPLTLSIIVGIAVGYNDNIGYQFALSRMFVFLPFFLLGHRMRREHFEMLGETRVRVAALFVIAGAFVFALSMPDSFRFHWLHGSTSYAGLGEHDWYAGIYRIGHYAGALAFGLAVMSLIPQGVTRFTHLGERVIYPHVFHGFFLKFALVQGWYYGYSVAWQRWAWAFAGFGLALFLSSRWVEIALRPIVRPDWLSRRMLGPRPARQVSAGAAADGS